MDLWVTVDVIILKKPALLETSTMSYLTFKMYKNLQTIERLDWPKITGERLSAALKNNQWQIEEKWARK